VEHNSRLGSMLYDDGVIFSAAGNGTNANTVSQSDQYVADSETVEVLHDAHVEDRNPDAVKSTGSRRELPQHSHRTQHQSQQAASSP